MSWSASSPTGGHSSRPRPNCNRIMVVVDISLPLLNGLDASQQLKKNNPNLKIIVLTMHSEPNFVTQAFRVGVSGYVLKQSVGSELVQAIREVVKGRTFVSPMVAQSLVDQAVNPSSVRGARRSEGRIRADVELPPT